MQLYAAICSYMHMQTLPKHTYYIVLPYLYFFVRTDEKEWHGRCESVSRFNLGAFWQLLYNAVRYEQEARILGVSIPTNQGPKKHDGTMNCISIFFRCFCFAGHIVFLSPYFPLTLMYQSVEQRSAQCRHPGHGEYDTITWILKPERPKQVENNSVLKRCYHNYIVL